MRIDFSRLGTPTDNAMVVSFNGWLLQEFLNENRFMSLKIHGTKSKSGAYTITRDVPILRRAG
ncbi:integrase core domain-containing protein [Dickeya chrysanthemi]|uniref:integrase core domain-containing protein n=1 Tax=Dickeya chrysanthemi TaxID=556 RepID=UPI0012DD7955